ncbi:MAG TPA: lauroyl acyltransferase [Alphaproteobacteria bacterium]
MVRAGLKLFGSLPIDTTSALGGRIARATGPRLGISHRARRHLQLVSPHMPAHQIGTIVRGMWENLGRVAAEYPHLKNIAARVELVGAEHIRRALARGKPIIYFAAHLGNWEVAPPVAARHGTPLNLLYRPLNNPWIDLLVRRCRHEEGALSFVPKGMAGLRLVMRRFAAGQHLGIIIAQKTRTGIPVPFFGREAMTTRAIAHLALKFDCAILPAQIDRVCGAHFRLTVHPAVDLSPTGDRKTDERAIIGRLNSLIESWIHHRPEQWLWLHRRWTD